MIPLLRYVCARKRITLLMWISLPVYIWTMFYFSTVARTNQLLRMMRTSRLSENPSHFQPKALVDIPARGQPNILIEHSSSDPADTFRFGESDSVYNIIPEHTSEIEDGHIQYDPGVSDQSDQRADLQKSTELHVTPNPEQFLSLAYKNNWVGFLDLDGRGCSQALSSKTNNSWFPSKIKRLPWTSLQAGLKNCSTFLTKHGYRRYPPVSEEEQRFPIAYIILLHSNIDQVFFLLRAIYRPHNVYCLSVDAKTGDRLSQKIQEFASCFPNVFLASKLEQIVYAGFSRLMADIHCMRDLLSRPEAWKYVINMPGQQFPLRTNMELVKTLTLLNGSNNIEGIDEKFTSVKNRHIYKHIYVTDQSTGRVSVVKTNETNPPAPHGLKVIKGSTYGAFARDFVKFVLENQVAQDLLDWSRTVLSPDEYFWSTLHHSRTVRVPGGVAETTLSFPYIVSFSIWKGNNQTCAVKYIRKICILTPEDLMIVSHSPSLFVNKFYIDYHPAALHCMDMWLFNRTIAGDSIDIKAMLSYDQPHEESRPIVASNQQLHHKIISSRRDKMS